MKTRSFIWAIVSRVASALVGAALTYVVMVKIAHYNKPILSVLRSWKLHVFGLNGASVAERLLDTDAYTNEIRSEDLPFIFPPRVPREAEVPMKVIDKFVQIVSDAEAARPFRREICFTYKALITNSGRATASDVELGISLPPVLKNVEVSVSANVNGGISRSDPTGLKVISIEHLAPEQSACVTIFCTVHGPAYEPLFARFTPASDPKSEHLKRNLFAIFCEYCYVRFLSCKEASGTVDPRIGRIEHLAEAEGEACGQIDYPVRMKFKNPNLAI